MNGRVRVTVEKLSFAVHLNDTESAAALRQALPLAGTVSLWGQEIYFQAPVRVQTADPVIETVEVGTFAYWPPGEALCLFWGPTPASTDSRPRAASPVILLGRFVPDAAALNQVRPGTTIRIQDETGT